MIESKQKISVSIETIQIRKICNCCGVSIKYGNFEERTQEIHSFKVSGGYLSKSVGDCGVAQFELCDECVNKLFDSFKHKPKIENTLFRDSDERYEGIIFKLAETECEIKCEAEELLDYDQPIEKAIQIYGKVYISESVIHNHIDGEDYVVAVIENETTENKFLFRVDEFKNDDTNYAEAYRLAEEYILEHSLTKDEESAIRSLMHTLWGKMTSQEQQKIMLINK